MVIWIILELDFYLNWFCSIKVMDNDIILVFFSTVTYPLFTLFPDMVFEPFITGKWMVIYPSSYFRFLEAYLFRRLGFGLSCPFPSWVTIPQVLRKSKSQNLKMANFLSRYFAIQIDFDNIHYLTQKEPKISLFCVISRLL